MGQLRNRRKSLTQAFELRCERSKDQVTVDLQWRMTATQNPRERFRIEIFTPLYKANQPSVRVWST